MSKFSIFTSFLSVIIVVILAELLVNEYIAYPEIEKEAKTSILTETIEVPKETVEDLLSPNITFDMLGQAGSTGITLQRVPFNGSLFESIDLREFKSVPVIKQNFLQNNRLKMGAFYEFRGNSKSIANEVYALLKEKSAGNIGASVNETNDYGDSAFYINYLDNSDTAFLVVKLGDNVYALTYKKPFHALIENIIKLLP